MDKQEEFLRAIEGLKAANPPMWESFVKALVDRQTSLYKLLRIADTDVQVRRYQGALAELDDLTNKFSNSSALLEGMSQREEEDDSVHEAHT